MGKLIQLYNWLVFIFNRQLPFSNEDTKALTIKLYDNDTWGIFLDETRLETQADKNVAAFHEGGHYATGTTHKVYSPQDLIQKHENCADKWAIKHLISKDELDEAISKGNTEIWQLAEYFDVTEDFMRKAICLYTHGNLAVDLYL